MTQRVALLCSLAVACSSAGAPDPVELAECVPGTWVAVRECATCSGSYVTTECDAEDCAEADVFLLSDDGRAYDFEARWSRASGTLSVILGCGAVLDSTWSVTEDAVLVQDYGRTTFEAEVSCDDTTLQRVGMAPFSRATPELAAALDAALASDDCTAALGE